MASNVFGKPVTNTTLRDMKEYYDKLTIDAIDRARVALEAKNAEEKDTKPRQFNEAGLRAILNEGVGCLIYNATGGPLTLVAAFEYTGRISKSLYPSVLQNGQWAAFVHAKDYVDYVRSSIGALVYEATQYPRSQWVLGWYHRDDDSSKCYVELRPSGYYSMDSPNSTRQALKALICGSKFIHNTETDGDAIFSSIGNSGTPIYEAILTKTKAML